MFDAEEREMLNNDEQWSGKLSTAITFLDDEHRNLAQQYLNISQDIKDETDLNHLLEDFQNLVENTRAHFVHEERVMSNINYPEIIEHKNAHDRLLEDFTDFLENIGAGFGRHDSHALAEYFKYWFFSHVREYDVKLKSFIDR